MISKPNRFIGLKSLRFVFRDGHVERGPFFAIKFFENQKRTSYRLAVVVSRKVAKSAVVRNRIRRRIYEIVRQNQDNILKPYDIVITIYNAEISKLSHQELSDLVVGQLAEAKILAKRVR